MHQEALGQAAAARTETALGSPSVSVLRPAGATRQLAHLVDNALRSGAQFGGVAGLVLDKLELQVRTREGMACVQGAAVTCGS